MAVYFNIKTEFGVETVDEISQEDFATRKEYMAELKAMRENYRMVYGGSIYTSQRSTKEWRER
tara:strand:- start:2259 stop:2447 length:189 start_codon:yes stop_codon:yes gene_type:complete